MAIQRRLRRLEGLQERQRVNERRLARTLEDLAAELKQVEDGALKEAEDAEQEMLKLSSALQKSLQDRSAVEARLAELPGAVNGARGALRRRKWEEDALQRLHEASRAEEEILGLQGALDDMRDEKERKQQQLARQRETVQRLSTEAMKDAAAAASLEAEAKQLKAEAAKEARRDLAPRPFDPRGHGLHSIEAREQALALRDFHLLKRGFKEWTVYAPRPD
ncbi:unnamed protein product [Effrenium voratum]|uniref:Uncharacterized protein n=1 Tax=Effrenium voratum TaxID=2562239 RepID=A0AA36IUI5_9DINO|nr:unnamed protein product [Effrenium voratum]